jgi:predicted nucleotidyltransferase
MEVMKELSTAIERIGVKEIARRTGLSPSTISRVNSGAISPSFEVVEKISKAAGFKIEISPDVILFQAPRLSFAKDILGRLRKELKGLGVLHVYIFGSVARKEDKEGSDIDIYLDFGGRPKASNLLKAEGRVIEAFGENKVDVVSWIVSEKGRRLYVEIDKDGVRVF